MKTLYLMQGVPASGKSTIAWTIADGLAVDSRVVVLSTDNYWYMRHGESGKNGVYLFDNGLLPEAHAWNQSECEKHMQDGTETIIIDNTNIKRSAAQPYLDLAEEYEYGVTVISVSCPVEVAIARNAERASDRQVPEDVIVRMYNELERIFE